MTAPARSATRLFRRRFGSGPAGVWSSPGRVNLIGEHTDYTGGLVLPFAIDVRAAVAIGPSSTGSFRIVSAQRPHDLVAVRPDDLAPGAVQGWAGYLLGVVWALQQAGHAVPALDIALSSNVPAGAGLSSSAAVECAVALGVSDIAGLDVTVDTIARIAQRAENDFVGVPCGLMDQMASAASTDGHALFFNVGTGATQHIPFDPHAAGLDVLVIDTRTHHSLGDGEYARRRADCEAATVELGLGSLAELVPGDLDSSGPDRPVGALARLSNERLRRRVRHVVTENARVRSVVSLLRGGNITGIGPLISASHASLRDDFDVSCAELDLAASAAESAGALGARMVGGGFGGSVIALVPHRNRATVESAVTGAFAEAGYGTPVVRAVTPGPGARRER